MFEIIGQFRLDHNEFDVLYCTQFFTYVAERKCKELLTDKGVIKFPLPRREFHKLGVACKLGYFKPAIVLKRLKIWQLRAEFNKKRGRLLLDLSTAYWDKYLRTKRQLHKYPKNNKKILKALKDAETTLHQQYEKKEYIWKNFVRKARRTVCIQYSPEDKDMFYFHLNTGKKKLPKTTHPDPIINALYESYPRGTWFPATKPMLSAVIDVLRKNKYIPEVYIIDEAKRLMLKTFSGGPMKYYSRLIKFASKEVGEPIRDLDKCTYGYLPDSLLEKLDMLDSKGNMKSLKVLVNGKFGKIWEKYDKNFREKIWWRLS